MGKVVNRNVHLMLQQYYNDDYGFPFTHADTQRWHRGDNDDRDKGTYTDKNNADTLYRVLHNLLFFPFFISSLFVQLGVHQQLSQEIWSNKIIKTKLSSMMSTCYTHTHTKTSLTLLDDIKTNLIVSAAKER